MAKEFWSWPEIRNLRLDAVGLFFEVGVWSTSFGNCLIPKGLWDLRASSTAAGQLLDAGLWKSHGDECRTRTMAGLRAGRGRPGLIMRIDRRVGVGSRIPSPAASGLFALCASWSLGSPNPGFVPIEMATSFARPKVISQLLDKGYWLPLQDGFGMSKGDHVNARWALSRDDERAEIPPELRLRIHERDGWTCVECGSADDLTLDHIIPWSWGGPDEEGNLRTLCRACNSSKGDRF